MAIGVPRLPLGVWMLLGWGVFIILEIIGALQFVVPRGLLGTIVLASALFAGYELVRLRLRLTDLVARDWPLFLLMGYIAISFVWAIDPRLSLQRVVVLGSVFVLSIYGSVAIKREVFIKVLDIALTTALFLSIFLCIFVPSIGRSPLIPHHDGSWSGLFGHRQYFVETCGAGIFLWMYLWAKNPKTWLLQLVRIVPTLIAAYFGDSKTSLLAVLLGMSAFMLFWGLRTIKLSGRPIGKRTAQAVVLGTLIFLPIAMYEVAPLVPELVGRDDNLSGRTRIWRWGFEFIQQSPVFGFGYRSFWGVSQINTVITQERAFAYAENARKSPTLENGHNGYYDTFFELGYVGLVGLGILTISNISRVVRLIGRNRPDPIAAFGFAVFAFIYVDSVAETVFYRPDAIPWPLFCCAYMLMGKALREKTVSEPQAPGRT